MENARGLAHTPSTHEVCKVMECGHPAPLFWVLDGEEKDEDDWIAGER